MTITKNLNGDQLEIVLEGRLDTMTAPDLEQVIRESLDNVRNLTVDMKNLEYVSSAGLRTLLIAKKQLHNKGNVKIVNANDIVKEVFEVTGFDELLDVE
ncbi:anti-sigma factor antagonist [Butyrivibrio proteoclasticus B316]|uniref:Anti-sigma factor antagonist n=1 Tax=Butyrivibrio proteoclasticus (strain ATCC 51982 / DSM 14932 / B316) TaxID=515622 RepID=E0RVZ2_BUTPB|nr:STAS domain-containing protein [Butyrivibrio proteoclasticus]ADL35674.1 anti-sigma factor antagonist [Butyrivibrio proteoclasticus B316]